MSKLSSQGITGQFQGLPSTVYVNSHLLKATVLANKVISSEDQFDHYFIEAVSEEKGDLDTLERGVKFRGVFTRTKDGSRQRVDQSKLYDLEKYGKVSSDLKRRSLTKKGSERFLDVLLCYWFDINRTKLPFTGKIDKKGIPYYQLDMDNPSSPKSYSIWFKVFDDWYRIYLKGSGPKRRRTKRPTGRTSDKTVAAEAVKKDSSQGSKSISAVERLQRAVQFQASKASVNLSSSGPSYPGE